MKKVLLFIAILFFFDRFGQAQSLTIEYNIGSRFVSDVRYERYIEKSDASCYQCTGYR